VRARDQPARQGESLKVLAENQGRIARESDALQSSHEQGDAFPAACGAAEEGFEAGELEEQLLLRVRLAGTQVGVKSGGQGNHGKYLH
jgi:hypothetical protein